MKTINKYLFEKFKINKDISNDYSLFDNYHIGQICLYLVENNPFTRESFLNISIGKIIKLKPNKIQLKNLTHFEAEETLIFYPDSQQNNKEWNYLVQSHSNKKEVMLIYGKKKIKEIIDYIKKSGAFNTYTLLRENTLKPDKYALNVYKSNNGIFENLEKEDYELIYKLIE